LAEKYYPFTPYSYCAGDPVNKFDPDGRAPGDFFKTLDLAAKDFGKYKTDDVKQFYGQK